MAHLRKAHSLFTTGKWTESEERGMIFLLLESYGRLCGANGEALVLVWETFSTEQKKQPRKHPIMKSGGYYV